MPKCTVEGTITTVETVRVQVEAASEEEAREMFTRDGGSMEPDHSDAHETRVEVLFVDAVEE